MIAALLLAAAAVAAPIGSAEVLASLDERHPVIAAATQELARASALRLQALGAWDVKVKGKIENYDDDASAWDRSEAEFSLPTRLYGARIEGGYALGTGDLPSYYGEKRPPSRVNSMPRSAYRCSGAGGSIPSARNSRWPASNRRSPKRSARGR